MKILLLLIALGVWANVAVSLFRPPAESARSQDEVFRDDMSDVAAEVHETKVNLDHLMMGNCFNEKLCH